MNALTILHAEDAFVVTNKPPGLLVIPGRQASSEPTARELLEAQLGARVYVVHRLDRDTSGLLIFALTAPMHRALSMAFEAGTVKKLYAALVQGTLAEPREIEVALASGRKGKMRVAFPGELGKVAKTLVRPVEALRGATLVDAEPWSGRTHQIRVHLASIGHPLLVDPQYGQPAALGALTRTPLHARSLSLPALEGRAARTFEAPLPEDFAQALTSLRSSSSR